MLLRAAPSGRVVRGNAASEALSTIHVPATLGFAVGEHVLTYELNNLCVLR